MATHADDVEQSGWGCCTVKVTVGINAHGVGVRAVRDIHVETRTTVRPLRRSDNRHVVEANQFRLLCLAKAAGQSGRLNRTTHTDQSQAVGNEFRQTIELGNGTVYFDHVAHHGSGVAANIGGLVHVDAASSIVDVQAVACVAVEVNGENGALEACRSTQAVGDA